MRPVTKEDLSLRLERLLRGISVTEPYRLTASTWPRDWDALSGSCKTCAPAVNEWIFPCADLLA